MDEQNRVEDIDRVDGGSTSEQNLEQEKAMMAENSQAQNGQGVQSVQAPYSQVAQPAQSLYQHMPQYGQSVQQPYQPQSQYGQPVQPTPYNNPMGYMGYENRQNIPDDVKKGSTHVPNMLNLIGIIMAVVSVFIPYAYMGTDARSIVGVLG